MAHSVSRSHLFAGFLAVAVLAVGTPAIAKKKATAPAGGDAAGEPGLPTSGKGADAATQSFDQERPKPILEEEEAAPSSDEKGNVKFAGSRAGKGKITVKAPVKDKAKVYLEGRYFGVAPRTINGIPPGDYIIEVTYPDGKSVTKPVSVSGDEEALVELGAEAETVVPVEKPMAAEQAQKRWKVAQIIGISSLVVGAAGLGLGAWMLSVQSDYDKTPNDGSATARARLDNLSSKGDKLAMAADICFVVAAVGVIGAGIIGYPAYKARKAERRSETTPDAPPPLSFLFAPGPGGASAGMIYHF